MRTQNNRLPAKTSVFRNRIQFRKRRIAAACSALAIAAIAAQTRADLYLTDGQTYSLGPLVSSENIYVANATTVSVAGDVTSSGSFNTGVGGSGNDLVTVSGTFNNSGALTVNGSGDVMNIGALNNTGTVNLNAGTLTITGGGSGVTDVPSGARYALNGGASRVLLQMF